MSLLTIVGVQVVDVGVSKGATGDGITTDSNADDGTDSTEDLVEHRFRDGEIEFSNVQRSTGTRSSRGSSGSGTERSVGRCCRSSGGLDGSFGRFLSLDDGSLDGSDLFEDLGGRSDGGRDFGHV